MNEHWKMKIRRKMFSFVSDKNSIITLPKVLKIANPVKEIGRNSSGSSKNKSINTELGII